MPGYMYVEAEMLMGDLKIHKAKAPLRTIMSDMATPTERITELAENALKEFVESTPSYIEDTTDFILKLPYVPEPQSEDAILFVCIP